MKYKYADLARLAPAYFKQALLMAILMHILFFLIIPYKASAKIETTKREVTEVVEWKPIEEQKEYKAPETQKVRTSFEIEIGTEDIDEDITIDETDVDVYEAMPDIEESDEIGAPEFIPYDEAPVPIRQIAPEYPEMARRAEIEGTVYIKAYIDESGKVKKVVVVKGVIESLDEAAKEAVKKWRFKPAKQRDKTVGVWYSIPIRFTLN